jgi:predicted nucleic acid-binding protein
LRAPSPGLVDDALLILDDMRPVTIAGAPVLRRAADLSIALHHHLFDTLYHAVALQEGATLVTADQRTSTKPRATVPLLRRRISRPDSHLAK